MIKDRQGECEQIIVDIIPTSIDSEPIQGCGT